MAMWIYFPMNKLPMGEYFPGQDLPIGKNCLGEEFSLGKNFPVNYRTIKGEKFAYRKVLPIGKIFPGKQLSYDNCIR